MHDFYKINFAYSEYKSEIANMIERHIAEQVSDLLEDFPAVALLGPRQVGKTTLAFSIAKSRPSVYLDMESAEDRAKLSNPRLYFEAHRGKLIIVDEVQHMPGLFTEVRGYIDNRIREGDGKSMFLFLGSASLELLKQSGESLAGRIAYMELAGFTPVEYPGHIDKLWLRGGFPPSILARSDRVSMRWRTEFVRTYIERDIPLMAMRVPAERLRRFWTMLAHLQGTTLNASKIGASLGLDDKTITNYVDMMSDLLLVRRLMPYHANIKKRLIKTPKIYIRDSGVVHNLLGIETQEQLLGHPVAGMSWEGFVVESIISVLPDNVQASFYRTSSGNEIDLILTLGSGEKWAIEIKRSMAPSITKGMTIALNDLDIDHAFVVYPGTDQFQLNDRVQVVGLPSILEIAMHGLGPATLNWTVSQGKKSQQSRLV
jgi:uncharacterized protein